MVYGREDGGNRRARRRSGSRKLWFTVDTAVFRRLGCAPDNGQRFRRPCGALATLPKGPARTATSLGDAIFRARAVPWRGVADSERAEGYPFVGRDDRSWRISISLREPGSATPLRGSGSKATPTVRSFN